MKEPPRTKAGRLRRLRPQRAAAGGGDDAGRARRASDPDAPALKVLDAILSGGKSSRLYNSLVYDKQIAAEAFSNADLPHDPGLFMVGAIMASGQTLAEGEAALLAEVKRLRDAPPTAAELAEAKNELVAGALRERETIEGRASALGYALRVDGDADAGQHRARRPAGGHRRRRPAGGEEVPGRRPAHDHPLPARERAAEGRDRRPPRRRRRSRSPTYDGPVFTLAPEAERAKAAADRRAGRSRCCRSRPRRPWPTACG